MSCISPDAVVPESFIAQFRPMWEAALDEGTPVVGKPIDVRIPVVQKDEPRERRVQELLGALGDAYGAISNVAALKAVIMANRIFYDLRLFGREWIDVETNPYRFAIGAQAVLYGTWLITNSPKPWFEKHGRAEWVAEDTVWVVGQREDGSWVRQELRLAREPFPRAL